MLNDIFLVKARQMVYTIDMSPELIDGLMVSSMIIFHVFTLIAIIALIAITWAVLSVRNKLNQVLDSVEQTSNNFGSVISEVIENLAPKVFKPRRTWADVAMKFLNR